MVVVLAVLALSGCAMLGPNESERYRDELRLDGFRRVATFFSDGAAQALFVGPAGADLSSAAHGPSLVVSKDPKPTTNGVFRTVALGTGFSQDSGNCSTTFWTVEAKSATGYIDGFAKVTDKEAAGLADGSLVGIEAHVVCAAQDDI